MTISRVGARALAETLRGSAISNKGSISLAMKETDQKTDSDLQGTSKVLDAIISNFSDKGGGDKAKVMMIEGDATNTIISKSATHISNFLSTRRQASNIQKPEVCKDHEREITTSRGVFPNSLLSNQQNVNHYMESGEVKLITTRFLPLDGTLIF